MPLGPLGAHEFAALMAPLGPFGPAVAVACSGGTDSLALTWLAARWKPGGVLALVADHGLRPESGAEAAATCGALTARGIPARLLRLAVPPGPAVQERARAARRDALLAACAAEGIPHLLLAHHADDQAETLLMRALAGSGPVGLAGMAAASPAGAALLLRPLLGVPKARLRATAAAAGLRPLEDPANADPRFLRARLRAVPPALDATPFRRRRARLEALAATRLAGSATLLAEGCARLDLPALGRDAAACLALARLVQAVGGGAHPPSPAAVGSLLARGAGALGGAVLRRDGWLLREAPAPPMPARAGALWDGRFRLGAGAPPGWTLGALGAAEAARFRPRHRHLPSRALAALPALRDGDGTLAAVPHLCFPDAARVGLFPLRFAPRGGPVTHCSGTAHDPCQTAAATLCSPCSGQRAGEGERTT